jgi:hypothetical protein
MFNPLEFPYVRVRNFVDANSPPVLSEEFYNPTQDGLARLYGGLAGYSMSLSNEDFFFYELTGTAAAGDRFGEELVVLVNTGNNFRAVSVFPTGANEHGVVHVYGVAAGDRGAGAGFQTGETPRYVDTLRWIYRVRVRCSNFATLETAPPGLQLATGNLTVFNYPAWIADGTTGFWSTFWDGGATTTALATVNDQWVTLWITLENADGVCRWYYKRDADPLPILADTQTLATPSLVAMQRWMRYRVTGAAAGTDNIELDAVGLCCQR